MSASKGPRVAVTVRMPRSLHRRLEDAAYAAGMSLSDWMVKRLEDRVKAEDGWPASDTHLKPDAPHGAS